MPVKADDDVEQMKKREEYIMELGAMYANTHQTQSMFIIYSEYKCFSNL